MFEAEDSFLTNSPAMIGSQNSQTVNAPIIHAQNVHFDSVTPILARATSATVSTSARPNIEYTGLREKRVFVSPFAFEGICDPRNEEENENSLQALVFQFENRLPCDRQISIAKNVIVKMSFESEDSVRHHSVSYGVWLNSPCNTTYFGIGDTQELVLICAVDNQLLTFEDRRSGNHNFHKDFSYLQHSEIEGLEIVDITLIDKDTQSVLRRKFKVWRQGARFCVAPL